MLKKQPKNTRGVIDNEVETKRKNGLYSLLMMFVGALIAVMVGVFFYLSPFFNDSSPPLNQAVEVVPLPETPPQTQEYQFYEVLPEQEFRSAPEGVSVQAEKPQKDVSLKVDTTVKAETPEPAEAEEEITVVEEDATYDEPEPSISISTGTGTTYILQVRSYETANEADLKRAEVMMAGIDAQVLKRDDGTGDTIYQVVSMPMQTRDEAMSAYRRLQSNGIDSVVVEQKR